MTNAFLAEFKKFLLRGNVVDMSVGIIIGASFNSIVKSMVSDVLMPILSFFTSDFNYTNLFVVLREGKTKAPYTTLKLAEEAGAVTINLGLFLNSLISFLLVGFALFMLLKVLSKFYKKADAAPTSPPQEEVLLAEIRDILKSKK